MLNEFGCHISIVSIHAPVMDANPEVLETNGTACFNPRARDGREVFLISNAMFAYTFQSTRP